MSFSDGPKGGREHAPPPNRYLCQIDGIYNLVARGADCTSLKNLLLKARKLVPLFIRLMTPNGAIWTLDQRTVIIK